VRQGFNRESEQNERKFGEAMIAAFRLLGSQAQDQRKIGHRAFGKLPLVKPEEMGEVALRGRVLQAKFREAFREGAGEAGSLRDGGEIGQVFRANAGVNDARGQSFHAEA
jgi:hypothetical protein